MKVGDLVRLRNGGPIMTVVRVTDTFVETAWFDDSANKISLAILPPGALVIEDDRG